MSNVLTQDIVNNAANALLEAHQMRPSNRQVLAAIGYGSMTTLTKMMATWRQANSCMAKLPSLPEGIVKEFQKWQLSLVNDAHERYEHELKNLQESEQTLSQINSNQEAVIKDLQASLKDRDQELYALQEHQEQASSNNSALQQQLSDERRTSEALRLDLAKNALQSEHMLQFKSELQDCRTQLEQARKNEADAQLRAAVALERVAGFERNLPLSQ